MKASEVIDKLRNLISEHGDLEVHDGEIDGINPINEIVFDEGMEAIGDGLGVNAEVPAHFRIK